MMPCNIKYPSHNGNILCMMTSPRRLIKIRVVKSTKFKGLVTVDITYISMMQSCFS